MTDWIGKNNYFGDRPMPIAGRHVHERERLTDMTMEEREWRARWCKDQELAPEEPKWVPKLEESLRNPIQRLYQTPLNWIFYKKLEPIVGPHLAYFLRHAIPKGIMVYCGICFIWYGFKYTPGNWETRHSLVFGWNKPEVLPGDPGYPNRPDPDRTHFYGRGFYDRKSFLNVKLHDTSSYSV